jgi:hypothetical protein
MLQHASILLLLRLALLAQDSVVQNRTAGFTLQPGPPIERTLAGAQTHTYSITLEKEQFVHVVVDQHGIDLVIRTFSPSGQKLNEFDSPNGINGPEDAMIVAATAGQYRIQVAPLDAPRNVQPGRYEIRIAEMRRATEDELKAANSQELLKPKALALVQAIGDAADQFRRPVTRAAIQLRVAQLLWATNEVQARKLVAAAIQNIKEMIASADAGDQNYFQIYNSTMQMRQQAVEAIASHDPQMALNFLRSTGGLENPQGPRGDAQYNRELQLEINIANRIAPDNPGVAFQLAEDALKRGVSQNMVNTLQQLQAKAPDLASTLSIEMVAKLATEDLLQHPEAGIAATMLLQTVRQNSLIPEEQYRSLFQKVVGEALSYTAPQNFQGYTTERNSAQNMLNALKSMAQQVGRYAPDQRDAIAKKLQELDQNNSPNQVYQNMINGASIDDALAIISRAPADVREGLAQQVANRVAQTGDLPRARQVIMDNITNVQMRQQALRNLDQQSIFTAMRERKLDDAISALLNFQPASERPRLIAQFVNNIGPSVKKQTALIYLDQLRGVLRSSHADNQEQMNALLALSRAYSRYDSSRAFAVLEPLIDQFNELSASAVVLDGFFLKFYEDGELIFDNGNSVGNIANDLSSTLGSLAATNFDRAKSVADRIDRIDVRMRIELTIAEQALRP